MNRPEAGEIVIADLRGGARSGKPNRVRPAVVLDRPELFPDEYPFVFVAPLSRDAQDAYPLFAVPLEPTPQNGCTERCWVLSNEATAITLTRTRRTGSSIGDEQLQAVRQRIAFMMGFPQISPLLASFVESAKRHATADR